MDSGNAVDADRKADENVSVMGNESSKLDISTDPLASSTHGQFHKVLVEPEYSILQPPGIPTLGLPDANIDEKKTKDIPEILIQEEIHSQPDEVECNGDLPVTKDDPSEEEIIRTSRIIVERSIEEALKSLSGKDPDQPRGPEKNNEVTDLDKPSGVDTDAENGIIDKAVDTAISDQTIDDSQIEAVEDLPEVSKNGINSDVDNSNIDEATVSADVVGDAPDDLVNTKLTKKEKKSKKNKAKEQYLKEREIIDSVKEFIKDEEKKTKDKKDSKKGISFPSMFKFSKRKQKSDTEHATANVTVDIKGDGIVKNNDTGETDGTPTVGDKPEVIPDANGVTGTQSGVRRLNSLDSGIVMDKYSDNTNGVEYSVVNKTKRTNPSSTELKSNGVTDHNAEIDTDSNKSSTEPIYINGEKTDADFVYINERAVDALKTDRESETSKETDADKESEDSVDSGTKVKRVDQIRKTEKNKIKKKSWSFQFPGHKKSEPEVDGVVSMDPGVSNKDAAGPGPKKSKWRFGKFSFRKVDDMSASTPDLNKQPGVSRSKSSLSSEVSESPEHVTDKKKVNKLKQIKAKKETKKKLKEAQHQLESDVTVRSSSLSDIHIGSNMPRSRRSIVEDDISYLQSDAFEGVAVSDLSQDEDEMNVSLDPSGTKTRKASEGKQSVTEQTPTSMVAEEPLQTEAKEVQKQDDIGPQQNIVKETPQIDDIAKLQQDDNTETKVEIKTEELLQTEEKDTDKHAEISEEPDNGETPDTGEGVYVNIKKASTGNLEAEPLSTVAMTPDLLETAPAQTVHETNVKLEKEILVEAASDGSKLEATPLPEITVESAQVLETEPMHAIADKLPSKYIYAGDDEYAQIVRSPNGIDIIGDVKDSKTGEPSDSAVVLHYDTEASESLKEENTDLVPETAVPVEEAIVDKTESVLECKAATDSFDKTPEQEHNLNNTDEKDFDSNQEANAIAYSNLIYSDVPFASELKQAQGSDKQEQADSESDAYVELEQLVQDYKYVSAKDRPANLDIISPDKDSIGDASDINDPKSDGKADQTSPVSPTVVSRASIKLSVGQPKVLIMKEVGVQAPDIHMPLDRELDFGFVKGKPNVVSVGVQVTDESDIKSRNDDGATATTPVAYF